MRFTRIGLLRYGALTETELRLRPDAALHVIYGPNEAGKSSALSAISDLLFGFPEKTDHGFRHDARDLRIAAELAGQAGTRLAFRRRKGRKNTLLADDDKEAALADDALTPFLGGLDRTVFERAFGLNSERLRKGAEEMLASGGEIGSLLFSAASGMMGLTRLRRSLEEEADSVYAPRRAGNRAFYQALDRHETARKAERESEVKSADWKRLVTAIAAAEEDMAALRRERENTRRALDRLNALRKLAPLIAEIDHEEAALGAFRELEALPSGFAATLAAAMEEARHAAAAERKAAEEAAGLASLLAGLGVDEALMAEEAAVTARFAETGAYQKIKQDLPRVEAEVDEFDLRLAAHARRLGLEEGADLAALQPPDALLARLRQWLDEARALENARLAHEKRLAEERDYLAALEKRDAVHIADPGPLAEKLAALRPELTDLARIDSLAVQCGRMAEALWENAARLRPAIGDLAALAAAPLPDAAAISRHRQALETLEGEASEAARALAALQAEQAQTETALRNLAEGGVLVTREAIAAARAVRDATVEHLQAAPSADLFSTLGKHIAEADSLSDTALADAERVSRHAALSLEARELADAAARAKERHQAALERLEAGRADYCALFAECGVTPLGAEAMLEWRRGVDTLLKERERLNGLEDELAALKLRDAGLRPLLEAMIEPLGLFDYENVPLAVLHRALEQRAAEQAQRFVKAKGREEDLRTARERLATLEARESEMEAERRAFRERFAQACQSAGLGEGAEPVMVETALDLWRQIPELLAERENRRRRVRGMRRDLETFEEAVSAMVRALAPDLSALSADSAIGLLNRRAAQARAAGERRGQLRDSLVLTEAALERARLAVAETAERLATLLPQGGGATELLQRLEERERLRRRLSECRARLVEQAEGHEEAEIRLALKGFDRVAAGLEIERLEAADREGVERFGTLTVRLADLKRERERLEAGAGAERAALERLSAEAEAKDLARHWVVLKLAAGLLNATMENYREAQTDPVMRRAGDLFCEITGGRFRRLVQLYDESDTLQLLAERQNGEHVPLKGLSEGTGDQLYLALRLAFIEDFARRNEPAPLIADDIFQTFDEERTAAGLLTLADTGASFQTILFTHQKSVAEAAEKLLGEKADIVPFGPV